MDNQELLELIRNTFDIGCEKATEVYELLPQIPDNEDKSFFVAATEHHKDNTKNHTPDCFINRIMN